MHPRESLHRAILVVAALGAATSLLWQLEGGELDSPEWWQLALPFIVWQCLPFLALFAMARWLRSSRAALAWMLAASLAALVAGHGAIAYVRFVASPDAQSALVYPVVAGLQLLGLFLAFILALVLRRSSSA